MAETETRNGDRSCSDSNECLVTAGDFQNQDDENVASDNEQLDVADLIEQNHLELVTNLDLERQFMFSYLRSKAILDEEDCERIINTGNTRQQKVSIFLDVIKRKGSNGMKHFVDALEYEYPELYKKMTGNDAASRATTLPSTMNVSWTGLAGKDYIDFDRMVLAKQLEQTVRDLHRVTRLHQKVQQEKSMLEKRLFEQESSNRIHMEHIEELKQLIEKISDIKKMSEECSGMSSNEALAHAQCLELAAQRELVRKTNMIIALQGKLLAQTEEIESIRTENVTEKRKNEALTKELMGLTFMFDEERRHSRRLNEQVQSQNTDGKDHRHRCRETRDIQFQLACSREENELLRAELEEFRKYSEVLNAKFNIVSQEKVELTEHNDLVAFSYQDSQERIKELCIICTSLQCDKDYLAKSNERLMSDVIAYREMQKSLHEELERIRADRDDAWKAMEKSSEELLQRKRAHDEAMHSQMLINRTLEQKYFDIQEELDVMRDCLSQTKEEVVATKKLLGESRRSSSESITQSKASDTFITSVNSVELVESKEDSTDAPVFGKRSNKDLLNSIKRKVSESEDKSSSMQPHGRSAYSCLSYEQISMLFPEPHLKSYDNVIRTYPRCRSPIRSKGNVKEDMDPILSSQHLEPSTDNTNCKSLSLKVLPTFYTKDPMLTSESERPSPSSQTVSQKSADSSHKLSESSKEKRDSFEENNYRNSLSDASFCSSMSSQRAVEQPTCNSPPVSCSSYVQAAILSPRFDYPSSFLHSTGLQRKIRSESSPIVLRTDTLSAAELFVKSMSVDCNRHKDGDFNEIDDEAFRSRSSLVNAEHKSSWERRRSLSVPVSDYQRISFGNFNI